MGSVEYLYDKIAHRKGERNATAPYAGGNGRIDRAVDLIRSGALGSFERPATLLDVGGATGNLGYALRDVFDHRQVVDITAHCESPAIEKGNSFHRANVDRDGLYHIDNREVSLVTALDFIEHIIDPEAFARECHRVLRPGGVVLINTPNIQHWRHLHSLVVDGVFPHTSGDPEVYHGGHLAFYNRQDLDEIFIRRCGFIGSTMHVQGLTADPPPPIWSSICGLPQHTRMQQLSYADLIYSCRKPA